MITIHFQFLDKLCIDLDVLCSNLKGEEIPDGRASSKTPVRPASRPHSRPDG